MYPWNKGLTLLTDNRLEKISRINKNKVGWNKGLTKETSTSLLRVSEKARNRKNYKLLQMKSLSDKFYRKVEQRKFLSMFWKEKWKDPEFFKERMKSFGVKPNKLELKFEKFLNENFPNEWKYVGDGQVILGGKCPDFINVNGKKQIIELYGDYWHKGQNPEDRIKIFEPFGYKTLIIWEKELKNLDQIKERILTFSKEE